MTFWSILKLYIVSHHYASLSWLAKRADKYYKIYSCRTSYQQLNNKEIIVLPNGFNWNSLTLFTIGKKQLNAFLFFLNFQWFYFARFHSFFCIPLRANKTKENLNILEFKLVKLKVQSTTILTNSKDTVQRNFGPLTCSAKLHLEVASQQNCDFIIKGLLPIKSLEVLGRSS